MHQSDPLPDIDLSALNNMEQEKVRTLVRKYVDVFSAHYSDLGCTDANFSLPFILGKYTVTVA